MGYIYGLDLSLTQTGVAIFNDETNQLVAVFHINTEKVKKLKGRNHQALRLRYIEEQLSEWTSMYPPTTLVIERGFSRYNTSTQAIFRVHGMINYLFSHLPQIYYPPKQVKETITHGDATKKRVAQVIEKELQWRAENEDESDALAVLLTYLIREKGFTWTHHPYHAKTVAKKPTKKKATTTEKVKVSTT